MKTLSKFLRIVAPTRKYMVFLALFSLISSGISVYWPLLLRDVINKVAALVSSGNGDITQLPQFVPYFAIFGAGFIISASIGTAQTYYQTKLSIMMEQLIRVKAFQHLSTLSIEFFDNEKSGKVISKISRGVNKGSNFIQNLSNWALSQIITYFAVIIIFLRLNFLIGILCIVVSIIHILVSKKMSEMLRVYHGKINKKYDEALGHQVEVLQNIHLVKHYAMEKSENNRFGRVFGNIYALTMERGGKRLKYSLARNALSEVLLLMVIVITVYETLIGQMTTGDIFLVATYINYVRWPLWNFSWLYDDAIESYKSIEDIVAIFDQKPTIIDKDNAKPLKIKEASISFQNVNFEYDDKKKVLSNLSLDIPGGKSLAIVGPSGVGKSTIIKLISRLNEPTSGKIMIDGQNILDITQDSLHKNIGVVLQDSIMFNDTILNNLTYGTRGATKDKVKKAIKAANLTKLIDSLPDGLNTMVGERGVKLSGGEAQRVAIARALIKDAPIIILDEATSSLDSESEMLVQKALLALIKGRTTIVVAHRLSTVMRADLIVVMDKGKIVEKGTHSDLVEHKGIYAKLFEIQSGGYIK